MSKYRYTVDYRITLWGTVDVEASSEEKATEEFEGLTHADLVEDASTLACGDVEIMEITSNAPPLHQLADRAE